MKDDDKKKDEEKPAPSPQGAEPKVPDYDLLSEGTDPRSIERKKNQRD